MTAFSQLTIEERYQIYALHAQGMSLRKIENSVKRSPSTISRELARNKDEEASPWPCAEPHGSAKAHSAQGDKEVTPTLMQAVTEGLKLGWTPEHRSVATSSANSWPASVMSWFTSKFSRINRMAVSCIYSYSRR